ncbi:hypothetical protein Tco_0819196 [Tanacetum coccineum]|uniref:Uncharacterized protein n=1 Tax=Tanacetum coccineum TaxID=301880 RepID=A0ABQ5A8S1_9ASTR
MPLPRKGPSISKLVQKKRKAVEVEPEVYIVGLHCKRHLPEGVAFIDNKVIEALERRLFFIDEFGDQAF